MNNSFAKLAMDKKEKLIEVCIIEFSQFGYINASTNRIVENAGISKGSLFKYFNTKEELYLYILDYVILTITNDILDKIKSLPKDLFQRILVVSEIEFDLYLNNPYIYKLFKKALNDDTTISKKLKKKYSLQANIFFDDIFSDIDTNKLKFEKKKTLEVIKWVISGFNEYFIQSIDENTMELNDLKNEYFIRLKQYMEIIKQGIFLI